jgi:hypothetical protein
MEKIPPTWPRDFLFLVALLSEAAIFAAVAVTLVNNLK